MALPLYKKYKYKRKLIAEAKEKEKNYIQKAQRLTNGGN